MDGMIVAHHRLSTGGRGENRVSNTITLPSPTSVIAEIQLASYDTFGADPAAFACFTGCTTNGADGLPPVENDSVWSWPDFTTCLIRNGLTSVSYEIDIANASVSFIVNVFFWPGVSRG